MKKYLFVVVFCGLLGLGVGKIVAFKLLGGQNTLTQVYEKCGDKTISDQCFSISGIDLDNLQNNSRRSVLIFVPGFIVLGIVIEMINVRRDRK